MQDLYSTVQVQPRHHVLDEAGSMAPNRQHELYRWYRLEDLERQVGIDQLPPSLDTLPIAVSLGWRSSLQELNFDVEPTLPDFFRPFPTFFFFLAQVHKISPSCSVFETNLKSFSFEVVVSGLVLHLQASGG